MQDFYCIFIFILHLKTQIYGLNNNLFTCRTEKSPQKFGLFKSNIHNSKSIKQQCGKNYQHYVVVFPRPCSAVKSSSRESTSRRLEDFEKEKKFFLFGNFAFRWR